jgi:hypothetical protein
MAAHEDEAKLIVVVPRQATGVSRLVIGSRRTGGGDTRSGVPHRRRFLLGPAGVAPDPVQRLVPGHGNEPGSRARREAVGRPLDQRGRARFLDRVLSDLEVAEEPGHDRDGGPPVLAEYFLQPG